MRLEEELINYITKVVNTAKDANVGNLVLEEGRVRGMDDEQTVVLLQDHDVPNFPFQSMGLTQVPLIANRFNEYRDLVLAEREKAGNTPPLDPKKFFVDITISEEHEFVRSISMKAGRSKIGARCSNPANVKAPRIIHDTLAYTFPVGLNMVNKLNRATNLMGNIDDVFINTTDEGTQFTVSDQNGEQYSVQFDDTKPSEQFSHKYPLKLLHSLLKQCVDGEFKVGEKGMLQLVINDLDIYVLPKTT